MEGEYKEIKKSLDDLENQMKELMQKNAGIHTEIIQTDSLTRKKRNDFNEL